jgi:two-component system sensor histidine kinase KdpD
MLAIMIASLLGRGPSLAAATVAVALFDVCFVPPRWTFVVADTRYVLTFVVMFVAGAVISTLVVRLRHQEREAVGREQRTATLLAFSRDVGSATIEDDVGAVVGRHLEDTLDVAATVLVPDPADGLVSVAGLMPLASQEITVARWSFEHRQVAGHGSDTLTAARVLCVPMIAGDSCVGVIAIQRRPGTPLRLGVEQRHLIDALARQAATAIARVQLGEQAKQAALRARTEELRSSLLSAVSHDLRTPLAVITGSATSLRDDADHLTPGMRRELLSSIISDAQRLARVLSNLLQLTRVETGLSPVREWVPAEEVIGSALTRLEEQLSDHPVELEVSSEVVVQVDPVLFEQALLNLIENALKHGVPPLRIAARRVGSEVHIEVADRGPGLPPGDPRRLFEKFVRASTAPGAGLGLAVVRAIVEAHGGRVLAQTRDGGGAVFQIVLPTPAPPVTVVRSEEHPAA